jgi:hypothetical protein
MVKITLLCKVRGTHSDTSKSAKGKITDRHEIELEVHESEIYEVGNEYVDLTEEDGEGE